MPPKGVPFIVLTIDIIRETGKQHNFKLLSTECVGSKGFYLWECPKGHQCEVRYGEIKDKSYTCKSCRRIPFKTYVDFVKKYGGNMITTEEEYLKMKSGYSLKYSCEEGHICNTRGDQLLKKICCGECNASSLGERTCRVILEYLFDASFPKNRDFIYPVTDNFVELDGYNIELKMAFEYNGIQHYKKHETWHKTDEDFVKQQNRDKFVQDLCIENGIRLIIIPYTVKYEHLYTFIIEQLPEYNFEKIVDYELFKLNSTPSIEINKIENYIKKKFGATLVSKNYTGSRSKLKCTCKNGHSFILNVPKLYENKNICPECPFVSVDTLKVVSDIEEFCKNFNYKLTSEYKNSTTHCMWQCLTCNYEFSRIWVNMREFQRSHECDKVMSVIIEKFCTKNNYALISEYIKGDEYCMWECLNCNEQIEKTWNNMSRLDYPHIC